MRSGIRLQPDRVGYARRTCDFGPGFYTTTRKEQAIDWAYEKVTRLGGGRSAMLVAFALPLIDFSMIQKLAFADGGETAEMYWSFVESCRRGVAIHDPVRGIHFPVVIGPVSATIAPWRDDRRVLKDADQISFHHRDGIAFINSVHRSSEDA